MGMYDDIRFRKLFCPWCGTDIEGTILQTKSGRRTLACYDGIEEFAAANPNVHFLNVYTSCPHCGEWIELTTSYIQVKKEEED